MTPCSTHSRSASPDHFTSIFFTSILSYRLFRSGPDVTAWTQWRVRSPVQLGFGWIFPVNQHVLRYLACDLDGPGTFLGRWVLAHLTLLQPPVSSCSVAHLLRHSFGQEFTYSNPPQIEEPSGRKRRWCVRHGICKMGE